jgi:hypothetical protein
MRYKGRQFLLAPHELQVVRYLVRRLVAQLVLHSLMQLESV